MAAKGIRGAITVSGNTAGEIESAVNELLTEIIRVNKFDKNKISHVIFSVTSDLNAAFPAKFARLNFGWDKAAMMCFNEIDVPNSLRMCLRVLVVINCSEDFEPEFVYLKGASNLRK